MTHINELLRVRQRQLALQRLFEGLLSSLHIWSRDKLVSMQAGVYGPVGEVEEPSLRKSAIPSVVAEQAEASDRVSFRHRVNISHPPRWEQENPNPSRSLTIMKSSK